MNLTQGEIKSHERASSPDHGRIYLRNQNNFAKRVQCYVPVENKCLSTDIQFIEFRSDCALGKISLKYEDDTFLHIVDICGSSSEESLNYPRSFSGSEILISFDIDEHDFQIEIDWKCSSVPDFSLNECIVDEDFVVQNSLLQMKNHFQDFSLSCLLTSNALDRTEGCETYEVIRNHDDSLWYLTPNNPLVWISISKLRNSTTSGNSDFQLKSVASHFKQKIRYS